MTYDSERVPMKISQGKRDMRKIWKVPNLELPLFSPSGVLGNVTSSASMCDNVHGVLPTREAHQASVFRFFLLGLNHINLGD